MSACVYKDAICQFFTEPNIGINKNVDRDDNIYCLILEPIIPELPETKKFEVPPLLYTNEIKTGYTRQTYLMPVNQGHFLWSVSRIHITGSYFGSDATADLDAEARYLGRSNFLDLLASLEMVFRSGFFHEV